MRLGWMEPQSSLFRTPCKSSTYFGILNKVVKVWLVNMVWPLLVGIHKLDAERFLPDIERFKQQKNKIK